MRTAQSVIAPRIACHGPRGPIIVPPRCVRTMNWSKSTSSVAHFEADARLARRLQRGELALKEQASAVDDPDVRRHLLHLAQQMARDEDGDAMVGGKRAHELANLADACRIETVGRLVEDEE